MAAARPLFVALALAAVLVRAASTAPQPPGASPPLAVIVHPSNAVTTLAVGELRRIFMLDTHTWPNGRKITVVLRDKDQPERAEAIRMICGMSERDYERQILFRTFQGTVNLGPRALQSAAAMLRFVHSAPGAIGYVNADEVDATVRLVRIDGLLPDDPRYPLRRRPRAQADE